MSDLARDTRGAVLILGVVMGALLVGALWHVASIGDAALWREGAQNAADAAAFENAVWHARGMNVLAAINIVMSMVLAILVIWRTILILVTAALIIATITCALSAGTTCGVATAVARVEGFLLRNDARVANTVMRVLGLMNASQTAVATAVPIVALAVSKKDTESAYDVESAWALNTSLLPSINDKGWRTLMLCARGFKAGKVGKRPPPKTIAGKGYEAYETYINQSRIGFVVSLPAASETYGVLCDKAGQFVLNNIAGALERMGVPSPAVHGIDIAMKVMGGLVSMLPGVFCAPIGGPPQQIVDAVGNQAKDACDAEKKDKRVFVPGPSGASDILYQNSEGKAVDEKEYMKDCLKVKKKDATAKLGNAFAQGDGDWGVVACGQPSKVWDWAVNGNVFMRSFSLVRKPIRHAAGGDRLIAVADVSSSRYPAPVAQTEPIVAHAEMFFDCTKQWASGECRQSAMWQLRWKARLRRVQPAGKLISTALEAILVSTLTKALDEVMQKYVTKFGKNWLAGQNLPALVFPSFKDTWLARYVKTEIIMGGLYGGNAFEWAGNLVAKNSAKAGVIH